MTPYLTESQRMGGKPPGDERALKLKGRKVDVEAPVEVGREGCRHTLQVRGHGIYLLGACSFCGRVAREFLVD